MARLLVFGNEKGGAGKSTLAMHVACGLLQSGASIGALDLDLRQVSFRRFFDNRTEFMNRNSVTLPTAEVVCITAPKDPEPEWETTIFENAISQLKNRVDYILVDCPGALTKLSTIAHERADTLITPLNDSFIDFDLLARIDPDTNKVIGPSIYSEMVWSARQRRALAGKKPIDWIVARNRLPALYMHNKRKMGEALQELSKRIGFRTIPGLSDRVIFKELFPKGLTVADSSDITKLQGSMSNVAAKHEIRDLILELNLPDFTLGF